MVENYENEIISIVIVSYNDEELLLNYITNELVKFDVRYRVIIVNNYNNERYLIRLSSLFKLTTFEIFFDNLVYSTQNNEISVINSGGNIGYSNANNLGFEYAISKFKSNFILFSNSDIKIVSDNILSELLKRIQNNPSVGFVGPNCLDVDFISRSPRPYIDFRLKYIYKYVIPPVKLLKNFKFRLFQSNYSVAAGEGIHYKLSGCFLLVNATHYKKCGGMDGNTFLYCEEEILAERMLKINVFGYYVPSVSLIHLQGQSINNKYSEFQRMKIEFESSSYYYKVYKNENRFILLVGKTIHYLVNFFLILLK